MMSVFRKKTLGQSEMSSVSHIVQALALGFCVIPVARNSNNS